MDIPSIVEWARKNLWAAMITVMFGFMLYGSFAFIGGYATKSGETFASTYDTFKRSVASSTVIDGMLHNFLIQYNASHISIARFHNSVRDVGNNALFFVTFENALAAPGITSEVQGDIPANVYAKILPSMLAGKAIFISTDELAETPLKQMLLKNGTKTSLYVPILDLSDQMIGMVVVSWINPGDVPQKDQLAAMTGEINDAAKRIGTYLTAKD